ncbi:hypothetical protein [Roseateles amylovorans]|uniref:Uncharacterized protein n=1 Tax=Roseateles amylovorans TaxID=2978473 RepID=A0ABY6B491_9BURK|nr:hypothetical protein [Roseateles amylovorans]UXH80188.1 hypothetical protein N4261_10035 [Roseateles amylovorans]
MDEVEVGMESVVHRAHQALNQGLFGWACQILEQIRPRYQVPLSIVSRACRIAVESAQIPRAAKLLERLADGDSRMFQGALGYDAVGNTLDFHYASTLTPEVMPGRFHPEDLREPQTPVQRKALLNTLFGNAALSSAIAEVLFELHVARKRLRVGSHIVVGEHGQGTLKATMARCIEAKGWTWQTALVMGKKVAVRGQIVIGPASGELPLSDRWAVASNDPSSYYRDRLAAVVERGDVLPEEAEGLRFAQRRTLAYLGSKRLLAILDGLAGVPFILYHWLWRDLARSERVDDLRHATESLVIRYRPLTEPMWCNLLTTVSRAGTKRANYGAVVLEYMNREHVVPTEPMLCLMACAANRQSDLAEVQVAADAARAAGRTIGQPFTLAMMKAAAATGDVRRWAAVRKELGGRDSPAFQSVREWEVLLLVRLRKYDAAMKLQDDLRKANVRFERDMMIILLKSIWLAERWPLSARVLQSSLQSGDDFYEPRLGWSRETQISTFSLHRYGLLKHPTPDTRVRALTMFEGLTILATHWASGRLSEGAVIDMAGAQAAVSEELVRPWLRQMGIVLEPIRQDAHTLSGFWRVAELPEWPGG